MFSLFAGSVMRFTALEIGKVFLVAGTVSIFVMPLMGRLVQKVDSRILLAIGVAIVTASQYTASHLTQAAGFWELVSPNLIRSLGIGFIFIPCSVVTLSHISPEQRGNATGLFNLTRELGGSLGTALMGMQVADDIKRFGSYLSENINVYNPQVQEQLRQTAATVGAYTHQRDLLGESLLQLKVTTQAMILSFENGLRWTAFAMSLGFLLIFLLKKAEVGGAAPSDAH
jgi:DHA2 family multidrug resistance protein